MKTYSKILAEVGNACDYVQSQGGSVTLDQVGNQRRLGRGLARLADNATAKGYFARKLPEAPANYVWAESEEEYRLVFEALGYVHGLHIGAPNQLAVAQYQTKVMKDMAHERAHKEVADFIGFRESMLGIEVTKSVSQARHVPGNSVLSLRFGDVAWTPHAIQAGPLAKVSKLAVAAIVAAPANLSDGDLASLEEMGYESQQDVAMRIRFATDPQLANLPLPLPFRD